MIYATANCSQRLKRGIFGSPQCARREQREVSRKVRQVGVQFPPEIFYELSHWTFYVRNQRIPQVLHILEKL